ncbi:hypothetical protein JSE7799_02516 [Jannaschia seosinensis]|uniref:Type VI secretion-associated protein, family n=1 Tax=Jannaschia seosinensis TaxID=313367 RepID=A0A0M7BCI8_9RHOB|nr:type VI secretion system-associated protein TagO [Jannaschia seosinensis]CUH39788.1 hypothetical protein JSE7799_02516 [Jannaschia seosinensis]
MSAQIRVFACILAALSGISIGYSLPRDADDPTTALAEAAPVSRETRTETAVPAKPEPPMTQATPTRIGWTLRTEPSERPDLTNVYLSVSSDEPLQCGPRRRATLLLRCFENRTAIYVAHDCATPPSDSGDWPVKVQIDDGASRSVRMTVDSRGEAFGHWNTQSARPLIETLTNAQSLHVRFADATGLPNDLRFPIIDLAAPLSTLREACHWTDAPVTPQAPTLTASAPPEAEAPAYGGILRSARLNFLAPLPQRARAGLTFDTPLVPIAAASPG